MLAQGLSCVGQSSVGKGVHRAVVKLMKEHVQQGSFSYMFRPNISNSRKMVEESFASMAQSLACVGQVLWAKGYTELVDLMKEHKKREGTHPVVDCYGNGEDLSAVREVAKKQKLGLNMKGGIDHIDPSMHDYKVHTFCGLSFQFGHPSASVCTFGALSDPLAVYEGGHRSQHPSMRDYKVTRLHLHLQHARLCHVI